MQSDAAGMPRYHRAPARRGVPLLSTGNRANRSWWCPGMGQQRRKRMNKKSKKNSRRGDGEEDGGGREREREGGGSLKGGRGCELSM